MLALITETLYEPRTVQVSRVIDGDTIEVTTGGKQYSLKPSVFEHHVDRSSIRSVQR